MPALVARVLHVDRANNRQSLLIRMVPAPLPAHAHDADEETFIVEGDLWFGDLKLGAGDYHIAAAFPRHPPGRTVGGCLVHLVKSLCTDFAFHRQRNPRANTKSGRSMIG